MRVLRTLLLTALVVLSSRIVHADELYTLVIDIELPTTTFEDGTYAFQEPSLLTSPTTITTGITDTGPSAVTDIIIDPTGGSCPFVSTTFDPSIYKGCEEVVILQQVGWVNTLALYPSLRKEPLTLKYLHLRAQVLGLTSHPPPALLSPPPSHC